MSSSNPLSAGRALALALALIAAAGMPAQAAPDAGAMANSLAVLSRCDARFFTDLARQRAALAGLADIAVHQGAGYFKVPEQRHPTESRVIFRQPVVVAGLPVVGYFDEIMDLPDGAMSYAWGYLVAATVAQTGRAWSAQVWDAQRLRQDDPVLVRSEVWTLARPDQGWAPLVTEPGLPKPGTVERVLLIEPYDGETAFIRFGCAIQGQASPAILDQIRPDLGRYR